MSTTSDQPVTGGTHVFPRGLQLPAAVSANGATVTTADGRRILNGSGGAIANSVGHGRREVADAIAAQAVSVDYVHATQFTTTALEDYASALVAHVPIDDARVFPVSGGSEANETALKLARTYHLARGEDRHVIAARAGAYHGNTRGVLDASDRAQLRAGYEPWIGHTVRVPSANRYRDHRSGVELAAETERILQEVGIHKVAAFIAEPIGGATLAGAQPPDDYWPAIQRLCNANGIVLILDEVMTGFGRTGRWFAADHWGLRPDIITAGKSASSGYWPLGLCLSSGVIADAVGGAGNFAHGFTWSHHPMGAAAAHEVLRILERESLIERAERSGARVAARLNAGLDQHPAVGDIRGLGLLRAVEFVADRTGRTPFDRAERVTERIVEAAFERGLTVYPSTSCVDGSVGDAVLLGPPFSSTDGELEAMVDILIDAISATLR